MVLKGFNPRLLLLELVRDMLATLRGDRLVRAAVAQGPDWPGVEVLAIGKAAAAMLEGARDGLGSRLKRALLITRADHLTPSVQEDARIEVLTSGHPLPTADSLAAGQHMLGWLQASTAPLLVLLSGGASSLVEVPAPGISLDDLQAVNRWLLGSGLDIHRMNALRKRLSRIKGGQLLAYLGGRSVQVWMISDVRGDDPAVIGSGLFCPAEVDWADRGDLPEALQKLMKDTPVMTGPPSVAVPEHRLLANLQTACSALVEAAAERDLSMQVHDTELEGDAAETGRCLAGELAQLPPGLHLWAGETTVKLPAQPGRGGRNQQLALAAAIALSGRTDSYLLAMGSDGVDGSTTDAGALVDGGSIARGELAGLDAGASLRAADAGVFLQASGDLVSTGPTGTNVRDIVMALKTE